MTELKNIELFLLDMDGTVNLGNVPIDGAEDFLRLLISQKKDYIFLTNNSSKGADDYVAKMNRLGFPCERRNVFTSGMAAGMLFRDSFPEKRVYVCGTRSLVKELESFGVKVVSDAPDIVLLGYDTELDYKKITDVCAFLDAGAQYYATNVDMVCPIEGGRFLPDCGSFADMIENAVHRRPVFIGKPEPAMVEIIAREKGISLDAIAITGDRIYTDIKTGVNAGITSILVMSGETDEAVLASSEVKPDYVFADIKGVYAAVIEKGRC